MFYIFLYVYNDIYTYTQMTYLVNHYKKYRTQLHLQSNSNEGRMIADVDYIYIKELLSLFDLYKRITPFSNA